MPEHEPLATRKAKAAKENKTILLYGYIFKSLCALLALNIKWHSAKIKNDEYEVKAKNQLRSIIFNVIELHTGRRPDRLD